jgi:hypothetical protein
LIAETAKRGLRPKALLTKLIEEAASPRLKFQLAIEIRELTDMSKRLVKE